MNSRFSAALLTISATVALPLLAVAPASAVTVTVGSIDYDVTVFMGTYSGNASLFQKPSAGKMPWWWLGNSADPAAGDLAAEFASQVFNSLGEGPTAGNGPVFAYALSTSDVLGITQNFLNPGLLKDETIAPNASVKYAIATPLRPAPSPVPAPMPIFGAAAAFGWSRQLRKRIGGSQR
jgi:hypothetical protein